MEQPVDKLKINDDVIWGLHAIGAVLNLGPRQAHNLLVLGKLPGTRVGKKWVSSRRRLLATAQVQ
jgi:hypothetical protein